MDDLHVEGGEVDGVGAGKVPVVVLDVGRILGKFGPQMLQPQDQVQLDLVPPARELQALEHRLVPRAVRERKRRNKKKTKKRK